MTENNEPPEKKEYFLKPGYIYLPDRPTTISTVLGSSVAVTLYDKRKKTGGMNHFCFPRTQPGEKSTARYGNIAVLTLIKMMEANGSKMSAIEAQIFGGAFNSKYSKRDAGRENLNIARRILNSKKIKIVSEDIGGELGRKIVFNTATYEIVTMKVDRLRESDWFPYDGDR
jgi:chemotaxis protein CheD